MKLAFVILNYGTYTETTECVESIMKYVDVEASEYHIVIVDNGSPDDSCARLQQLYQDSANITILVNKENLGFAKGNNKGIEYVNSVYSPEYVVVLNSDTELIQYDLYNKIDREYKLQEFAVLGPMITMADGICDCSPWAPIKKEVVLRELQRQKKNKRIINAGLWKVNRLLHMLFKIEKKAIHEKKEFWKRHTGVELQGAFLIFSAKAFEKIKGFDNRTFLYYEEQLLYLNVVKNGMQTVYTPDICVYHKEGRSTKRIKKTSKNKMLFISNCNIESLKILSKEMMG